MNDIIHSLHQEAKQTALRFRQAESDLIDVLIRLDEHRVFIHLGHSSLFEYCVQELKLSEATACAFIGVARKAREIPQLKTEILNGTLSVSKAKKMTSVLTPEAADLWLEKAKILTHKALEKEIARQKPEVLVQEGLRYISEDRLALRLSVSEALMDQLVRLRDLLSQQKKEPVNLEKALEAVVGEYLERHDPVQKAERAMKRQATKSDANLHSARNVKLLGDTQHSFFARQGMKQLIKHQVMARDQGRCAYVYPNGRRCKEQRFLEIHHIKPVSFGGSDTLENLTLLCSAHHKHWHLRGAQYSDVPAPEQSALF